EAGIVYCSSRREVEQLSTWLQGQGLKALPYHAGLADHVRSRHQDAFLDEEADIVVATVAFGMGIDRSNGRVVGHTLRAGGKCSRPTASSPKALGRCSATWSDTHVGRVAGIARCSSTSASSM